jgi:hypothetical protein
MNSKFILLIICMTSLTYNCMAMHFKSPYPAGSPTEEKFWKYECQKFLYHTFRGRRVLLHVMYNTYYRCYCTYPDKNKLYIFGDGIEEIVWVRCFVGDYFWGTDDRGLRVKARWNTYYDRAMKDNGYWSFQHPVVPDDPSIITRAKALWCKPLSEIDRYHRSSNRR